MLRRTFALRVEHWASGVSAATQNFALGDKLPTINNSWVNVTKATGAAASVTGTPQNVLYDTESLFDPRATCAADKAHFRTYNGIGRWVVVPLNPDEASRSVAIMEAFFAGKDVEKHFWQRLFKDFPSLSKPFTDELKSEYIQYFSAALRVADDEAAVTALADEFITRQLEVNFIHPTTQWRISEALATAIELHMDKNNKYEKRAVREALERITKIGLNTVEAKPWSHESGTSPLTQEIGGFRAWHEAGGW
jgi:hypothetical protein